MSSTRFTRGNHVHNNNVIIFPDRIKKEKQILWKTNKSINSENIIFVKQGGFYECFHKDADILNEFLGNLYLYGPIANTGFPMKVLDKYVSHLQQLDYKVILI